MTYDFCYALNEGEILNEGHKNWPLFILTICGSKIETLKMSKRIMCTLKHMPLRLQVFYEHKTEKCLELGGGKDPSVFLGRKLLFEGLIQAEEIKEIFEKLLKESKMTYDEMIKNSTIKVVGKTKVEPDEAVELLKQKKAVMIDVREDFEFDLVEFKIAIHIPLHKLPDNLDKLDKDKIIICACPMGFRSNKAVEYLRYKGFDARNLMGGFKELLFKISGKAAKEFKEEK